MKTKIIFTINNLDTAGMKYVLASIVKGINKNVFEPVIFVNKKTNSELETELSNLCEIHEITLRNPGVFAFLPTLVKNYSKIKKNGSIAHSFDYSSDWYEGLSIKLANANYIVEKTNLSFDSYRWQLKFALADHIICLSSTQSKILIKYKKKLSVIPTGIDTTRFGTKNNFNRAEIGIKETDIVFISVAHLVEVKGYVELIEAVSNLKKEFRNLKFICVGKGDPEFELKLKLLAKTNQVEHIFHFVGNKADINKWFSISDIKILATQNRGRREAFGAAIVEAMAAGLPVLATRSGGPEDIVIDGETGWLVDGDGVASLEDGIRIALRNRENWNEIGQKGQKRAREFYSEKQMIQKYIELYSKFIPSE